MSHHDPYGALRRKLYDLLPSNVITKIRDINVDDAFRIGVLWHSGKVLVVPHSLNCGYDEIAAYICLKAP